MGVRVLFDEEQKLACLYCSVTDWAFGPVAYGDKANKQLYDFLKWISPVDPRSMDSSDLESKWVEFVAAQRVQ